MERREGRERFRTMQTWEGKQTQSPSRMVGAESLVQCQGSGSKMLKWRFLRKSAQSNTFGLKSQLYLLLSRIPNTALININTKPATDAE